MENSNPSAIDTAFQTRRDAVWYLVGLGGFWGIFAAVALFAVASGGQIRSGVGAPLVLLLVLAAMVVLEIGTRRLHTGLTGEELRAWPFGHPSMGTMIKGTMPSTIAAAGRRVGFNGPVTAAVFYLLLALDLISLALLFTRA